MKRGMPSGAQTPDGIIFLLALIFSKAPPRYPPHHGAHWAYTGNLRILIDQITDITCRYVVFRCTGPIADLVIKPAHTGKLRVPAALLDCSG